MSSYRPIKNKFCDGYPQVQVSSKEGTCVGLMVDSTQGLRMPRYAVQLSNGVILVTDMGSWSYGRGTVWAISEEVNNQRHKSSKVINLFPKTVMTMPNGIAVDEEDRVYIGTPTAIYRFSPLKNNKLQLDPAMEVVVSDFGQSPFRKEFNSKSSFKNTDEYQHDLHYEHSLVNFVFDRNFKNLFVNIGSLSDACNIGYVTKNKDNLCEQTEGVDTVAAIYHYEIDINAPKPKVLKKEVFARGLRNSMALALHQYSDNLLQGENGRDFPDIDRPDEELNHIRKGEHYGWPYCYSEGKVSDEYKDVVSSEDCLGKKYTLPLAFLPPHSAPLGMLYDEDKLYITLHGYKQVGHRLIAFDIDRITGLPLSNKFENIIFNWNELGSVRHKGSPVGLLKLNDGSIIVVEDKNKTILKLSSGETSHDDGVPVSGEQDEVKWSMDDLNTFQNLREKYFNKVCSSCHSEVFNTQFTASQVVDELYKQSFIDSNSFEKSKLFLKLDPANRLMPPPGFEPSLSDSDRKEIINTMSNILKKY